MNREESAYLAIDMGASGGKVIRGRLSGDQLRMDEVHRFPTGTLSIGYHLFWDVFAFLKEIKAGIRLACQTPGPQLIGLGIDTWGVDFGLFSSKGDLIGLPYAYRDPRTDGIMAEVFKRISRRELYELTGVQFLPFNSIFQLFSMVKDRSPQLKEARKLLFIPDIFNHFLCGTTSTEWTYATTSQLVNPRKRNWEDSIFNILDLPREIMPDIREPATECGTLLPNIRAEIGCESLRVISVASHDTASAVAAIPAHGRDWAYISSGTWSLLGVETGEPVINDLSQKFNFTNEGGIGGSNRLLKNITGLWLLQEYKKNWSQGHLYSYKEMISMAEKATPFSCIIDPDAPEFLCPTNMEDEIRRFLRKSGQNPDVAAPEMIRAILEGLALAYSDTLGQLARLSPSPIRRIHIIGGGAQNRMLCQFTANATNLPVLAGPVEATSIGNVLAQALATGQLKDIADIRRVARYSFVPESYAPREQEEWQEVSRRFRLLKYG